MVFWRGLTIKKIEGDFSCNVCNAGLIIKPSPVHSCDFDPDGRLIKYCNNPPCSVCKSSDTEMIIEITGHIPQIGNNFNKKILELLCNRGRNFNYEIKKTILKEIKDKKFYNPNELTEYLLMEFEYHKIKMDYNIIIYTIYRKELGNFNIFSLT